MLRQTILIASLALAANLAQAAEAGKIIYIAGPVEVADKPAQLGAAVEEGAMLSTGDKGYLYISTLDKGLFVLRPNTKARIAAYHIDGQDPTKNRIKLELLSGTARSRSGEAVKLARQNFRFNTPVAAIGVRGTDFTVFTDQNTTRVTVMSGGVVVSGFEGACRPEGLGPCEGGASRELSAAQRGQLLQVQRGAVPQLMQAGSLAPDAASPARPDEPIGKNGSGLSAANLALNDPNFDPQKHIDQLVSQPTAPTQPVTPSPVIGSHDPATDPVPVVPERDIVWGRYKALAERPATIDFLKAATGNEVVAVNDTFALYRTPGKEYVSADRGSIGFTLKDSEAFIYTGDGTQKSTSLARVENGKLTVDFGKASFFTSFDLIGDSDTYKLQSQGTVSANGLLSGDSQFTAPTNVNVTGVLSNANGGSAAYIFSGRLDKTHTTGGITYWGH
ncbi:MAG: FecR domain-containing protein [Pseudomonadota bacterium]